MDGTTTMRLNQIAEWFCLMGGTGNQYAGVGEITMHGYLFA
jgi:hypothetical protein